MKRWLIVVRHKTEDGIWDVEHELDHIPDQAEFEKICPPDRESILGAMVVDRGDLETTCAKESGYPTNWEELRRGLLNGRLTMGPGYLLNWEDLP